MTSGGSNRLTLEQVKARIHEVHGLEVTIVESTYVGPKRRACFIDHEFGEWWIQPRQVFKGAQHPKRKSKTKLVIKSTKFRVELGCFSFDDDSSVVYVDETLEDQPRVFYVGQGRLDRIFSFQRNNKHTATKNKLGLQRRVLFKCTSDIEIDAWETKNIRELNTFTTNIKFDDIDIGCNLVPTGGSRRGTIVSKQTRLLISMGVRKKCEDPKHIQKLSDSQKKRYEDPFERELTSRSSQGRKYSEETCQKHAISARKQWADDESRNRIISGRWSKKSK